MRKKLATLLLTLAAVMGFAAGMLTAPPPADAACKVTCCPTADGGTICWECCQEPCFNPHCGPY